MTDTFLPETSISYLRKIEKEENNPKVKKRILACIYRKEGKTIEEIASLLNKPYPTTQNWLARIEKNGIEDRYDKKHKGAKCRLEKKQLRQLVRDLEKGPEKLGLGTSVWSTPLITRYIHEKFGVEYNVHSVWDLIHRLGFKYRKSSPRHHKAATPEEQEKGTPNGHIGTTRDTPSLRWTRHMSY